METRLEGMAQDVEVLKTDVSVLKTDVSALKTGLEAFKNDVKIDAMEQHDTAQMALLKDVLTDHGRRIRRLEEPSGREA